MAVSLPSLSAKWLSASKDLAMGAFGTVVQPSLVQHNIIDLPRQSTDGCRGEIPGSAQGRTCPTPFPQRF